MFKKCSLLLSLALILTSFSSGLFTAVYAEEDQENYETVTIYYVEDEYGNLVEATTRSQDAELKCDFAHRYHLDQGLQWSVSCTAKPIDIQLSSMDVDLVVEDYWGYFMGSDKLYVKSNLPTFLISAGNSSYIELTKGVEVYICYSFYVTALNATINNGNSLEARIPYTRK